AGVALGGIAGEPHLNRIPQRMVDDRRVFAGMGLSLVNDLAAIGAVPQHQVERPAREWLTADHPTRSARPRLAFPSLGFELGLQQPHRAEFGIAAKDRAHDFCLAVDDAELAVAHPISERRHPAHPHPLLFWGGDLVADALADDLASRGSSNRLGVSPATSSGGNARRLGHGGHGVGNGLIPKNLWIA